MPHISVISPVYRAEDCVAELCQRLIQSLSSITDDFEIVLIEDRSPDNSWAAIQREAEKDARVIGIRLARNFGQHRAITAGIDRAQGDWLVIMDCDLQDAPEDIPLLYAKAQEGYEIVTAQFESRSESSLRQQISRLFWTCLSWLTKIPFDHRIGNFRIMSSQVAENFRQYREQSRLLGGIVALMGFTSTHVTLQRHHRFQGETSYTLNKLFAAAIEIAMSYSGRPLKISVYFGFILSSLSLLIGLSLFVLRLTGVFNVPGWASVMISIYFVGGLLLFNLGIIGYYLSNVYDETKQRPLYIIESDTSISSSQPKPTPSSSAGAVYWLTGLSGAGKSTVARALVALMQQKNMRPILLDGDDLRQVLNTHDVNTDYTRDLRIALALRYSALCKLLAQQGFTVVIATISLFDAVHEWNRAHLPQYREIFLDVPLEELKKRDPKGLYKKAEAGEISSIAGIDLAIDIPKHPDLTFTFPSELSPSEIAEAILSA